MANRCMIEGDEELCIGCRACEIVCALSLFGESNPEKSAIRISTEPDSTVAITVCNQCGECERVCPEGAIYLEDDIIKINNRCTGCYICVESCPAGALFTHVDVLEPIKCTHCLRCVESCPVNALYVLTLER